MGVGPTNGASLHIRGGASDAHPITIAVNVRFGYPCCLSPPLSYTDLVSILVHLNSALMLITLTLSRHVFLLCLVDGREHLDIREYYNMNVLSMMQT